jgi:hypothetical protein
MGKIIFKFNNGNFSILCSHCNTIVKNGRDFTEKEWSALHGESDVESVYCDSCKDFVVEIGDIKKDDNINEDIMKNIVPHLKDNYIFKEQMINGFMKKIFNKNTFNNEH